MSVHSATCQMSHVQASQSFVQERGLACVLHDMTVSFECTRRGEHRARLQRLCSITLLRSPTQVSTNSSPLTNGASAGIAMPVTSPLWALLTSSNSSRLPFYQQLLPAWWQGAGGRIPCEPHSSFTSPYGQSFSAYLRARLFQFCLLPAHCAMPFPAPSRLGVQRQPSRRHRLLHHGPIDVPGARPIVQSLLVQARPDAREALGHLGLVDDA